DNWPQFHNTSDRIGVSTANTAISTSNVAQLALQYSVQTGGSIAGSPVVTDGMVFFGSGDGYAYAVNQVDGSIAWKALIGASVNSTASVSGGAVYMAAADGYLYALDEGAGSIDWRAATGSTETGEAIPLV